MKKTINLDDEACSKLQTIADEDRRSFNNLVQGIIYDWLVDQEKAKPPTQSEQWSRLVEATGKDMLKEFNKDLKG